MSQRKNKREKEKVPEKEGGGKKKRVRFNIDEELTQCSSP